MESIAVETKGSVTILRMQHGKANTLDLEFTQELIDTLEGLGQNPGNSTVLTGSGTIFSAGVDLLRLQSGGSRYIQRFVPLVSKLVVALLEFPRPLVSAINGHAIAGGCVIACATDYRIMARNSGRIGVPELRVGLPFPTAALEVVRNTVLPQHLRTVALEALTFTADEARAVGLVDDASGEEELLARAVSKAEVLGTLPPIEFALTKQQLQAPMMERIAAGAARDAEVALLWQQPAVLERVRGYVERTFKPAGKSVP